MRFTCAVSAYIKNINFKTKIIKHRAHPQIRLNEQVKLLHISVSLQVTVIVMSILFDTKIR